MTKCPSLFETYYVNVKLTGRFCIHLVAFLENITCNFATTETQLVFGGGDGFVNTIATGATQCLFGHGERGESAVHMG